MEELRLERIEREIAEGELPRAARYEDGSNFDQALLGCAILEMAAALDGEPELSRRYAWVMEPGAFVSGVEAWLQYEVIMALKVTPFETEEKVVVIRVLTGLGADTKRAEGARCWFIALDARMLWAHGALAQTMAEVKERRESAYEGEERWCRSDMFGGGRLEALVREEHVGHGYVAALSWLRRLGPDGELKLGDVRDWLPGVGDPDYYKERWESKIPPESLIERLVRAPLRFAVFRAWGSFLTHVFDDQPQESFWPMSAADIYGQGLLLALEEKSEINGVERSFFFARGSSAIGMSVYLQLARTRLIRDARVEAVRLLCLPTEADATPKLRRRGAIDAQMRLMNVINHRDAQDEQHGLAMLAAFDEMQVFFGLVAAVELSALGATVWPMSMCSIGWEDVRDYLEKMTSELGDGM